MEHDPCADVLSDLHRRPVREVFPLPARRAGEALAVLPDRGIQHAVFLFDACLVSRIAFGDHIPVFRFERVFQLRDLLCVGADLADDVVVALFAVELLGRRFLQVEVGYRLCFCLCLLLQLQMVVLGKFAQYDLRFIPQIVHHSLVGVFSCLAEPLLLRLVPQSIRERLLLVRSLLGAVDDISQHIRRGNIRREKRLAVFLGELHIPHIRRRVSPVIGKRDPCRPCPLAQLPRLVFAEIAPHILRYIELAALQIAPDALVGLIDPRAVFR